MGLTPKAGASTRGVRRHRLVVFALALVAAVVSPIPLSPAAAALEPPTQTLSPGAAGDQVGASVAAWEDKLIIGAPGTNGGAGTAYVYGRSAGGTWTLEADLSTLVTPGAAEALGSSVAIAGNTRTEHYTAVVGGPGDDLVRIFEWDPIAGWTAETSVVRSEATIVGFGTDVDVQRVASGFRGGTYQLAVGAPGDATTSGNLSIYRWDGTTLATEYDAACVACTLDGDRFAESVAIDGTYAVAGAPGNDLAVVLQRDDMGGWNEVAALDDPSGITGADFGAAVDLDILDGEPSIVVGAPLAALAPTLAPIVRFFGSGSTWTDGAYFDAPTAGVAGLGLDVAYQDGSTVSGGELFEGEFAQNPEFEFGGSAVDISDSFDIVVGDPATDSVHLYRSRNDNGAQVMPGTSPGDLRPAALMADGRDGLDIENDRAIAGAPGYNAGEGTAFVMARSATAPSGWEVQAELSNPTPSNAEFFGTAVAINDTFALVTEPFAGVHWYTNAGGSWNYEGLIATPITRNVRSLDLDGNRFAASATASRGPHEVFVYTLDAGGAAPVLTNVPAPIDQTAEGTALVKLQGEELFVAVSNHPTSSVADNNGRVYVFTEDVAGGTWAVSQVIDDEFKPSNSFFGTELDVDGDQLLVGALRGHANLYERDAVDGWVLAATLQPRTAGETIVDSVALDGGIAVLSDDGDSSSGLQTGTATVFNGSGASWTEVETLAPVDPESDHSFGSTIALDGTTLMVGARYEDTDRGVDSGAVYPFELTAPPGLPTITINEPVDGGIYALDGGVVADFSCTSATGGPLLCIGQIGGVTVNSGDPIDTAEGAFTLTVTASDGGGTTSETVSFTVLGGLPDGVLDPQAPAGALAGSAVATSDRFVAVGAPGEDGEAGAVYVFRRGDDGSYAPFQRIDAGITAETGARFGAAVDMMQRGNQSHYLVVGAPGETVSGLDDAGAAYIYRLDSGTWVLRARGDGGADAQAGAALGTSVGVANRNDVIAGAPFHDAGSRIDAGGVFSLAIGTGDVTKILISPDAGATQFGFSLDTASASAVVGAPGGEGAAYQLGTGGNVWSLGNRYPGPVGVGFGTSVARWFGTTVVGAPGDFGGAGSVRLFQNSTSGVFETDVLGTGLTDEGLGTKVDVMDGIIVANGEAGRVWSFSRVDGLWDLDGEPVESLIAATDRFGSDVAIEGERLFIGHAGVDTGAGGDNGVVEVFDALYDELPGRITAPDGDSFDNFGVPATDGTTTLIGAPNWEAEIAVPNVGSVYVYDMTGAEPALTQQLTASDLGAGDQFGADVAVDGDLAIVGAPGEDTGANGAGSVYVFLDSGTGWNEIERFQAPIPTFNAGFGRRVELEDLGDGTWLAVIGSVGSGAGAVEVFILDPSGSAPLVSHQATLLGEAVNDRFGFAVAADGPTKIIVGAPEYDGPFVSSGAAYVYTSDDTEAPYTYSLFQKLESPNPGQDYDFGSSVDIDGPYVAVGSVGEDVSGGNRSGVGYGFALDGGQYVDQVVVRTLVGTVGGNGWGSDVALEGELLVVAVNGQDNYRLIGRALVRDGDTWVAREEIRYPAPAATGGVGARIDLAFDGTLISSALSQESRSGQSGGAAYYQTLVIPEPPDATITLGRPVDGGTYVTGDPITAIFACVDSSGAAVADCSATLDGAPITVGDPINTTAGTFTFEVTSGAVTETATFTVIDPPETDVTVSYTLSSNSVPVGVTTVPLEDAPAAEIAGVDADISGVSAASLGTIDFDEPPTDTDATTNPLGDVTLGELGLDTLGPAAELLFDVPLTEFPIDGGWEPKLVGSPYEGVPLQAVTLGDVYNLGSVQAVTVGDTDVSASPLRAVDLAAVGFGELPLDQIDLDGDPLTDPIAEWCAEATAQELDCVDVGLDAPDGDATLGALSVAGFDISASPLRAVPLRAVFIEASPLRAVPLRAVDIEASPLRAVPLRAVDIEASPLRAVPLRAVDIEAAPLRAVPLRAVPLRAVPLRAVPLRAVPLRAVPAELRDNLVDCVLVDCSEASNLTLGDAVDVGAYRQGTATFGDFGDALADLTISDIVAYLDQQELDELISAWSSSNLTLGDLAADPGLGDITLGDLLDTAFGELEAAIGGGYVFTVEEFFRFVDFDAPEMEGFTIGDFLLLFLPRESYAWDQVDISALGIQTAGTSAPVASSIDLRVDGILEPATAEITLALPETGVLDPDSVSISPAGTVITNLDVTSDQYVSFDVIGVQPSVDYRIDFALFAGVDLGSSQTIAEVSVAGVTEFATSSLTVTEAFEPGNNTPGGAVSIVPDTLYLSHISSATDTDFYRLTVPNPDTRVSVILSNLPADYDLVVYGPEAPPIVPSSGDAVETVPDPDFDVNPSNDVTQPAPLDDIPTDVPGFEIYGVSYNRDTRDDQVDILAADAGDYLVQITKGSTLGTEADQVQPYALRVATTAGSSLPCQPLSLSTGATGTSTPIDASTNTLFLFNQQRFAAIHGAAAAQDVAEGLADLQAAVNADSDDGVDAAILAVDSVGAVQSAYATWDAAPCEIGNINGVVGAIAAEIDSIRATNDLDHIMIVGGDDVIPFGRVTDATSIANEQGYTSSLGGQNNALRASMAAGQVLTDDPYGDPSPASADNREVYVSEVALGRLVEGPAEILANINLYLVSDGQLDTDTGFVAGYDFLDDGSEAVASEFEQYMTGPVERLINDTWSDVDLGNALTPPADVNSIAAHFDHYRALPAISDFQGTETDLYEVGALAGTDYSGAVVFSMGCHSGLSVSDGLFAGSGIEAQDWAQSFLEQGASVYVASTGYAYGDDVTVALTEKLMVLFAEGLGEYATVGEALLYAKQEYSADLTAYGVYDEKALMEAVMYGIPFFRLDNPPVDVTINEPTLSTSPFGPFANLAVSPDLSVDSSDAENTYWYTTDEDGDRLNQVTSGYPILPAVEIEVTQQSEDDPNTLELDARGAMLESLTTTDITDVDAATARAVYDLAENEPNTDPAEVTFALAPTVNTFISPAGVEQQVTMTVGAFESTSPDGVGTMRLYDDFDLNVYYADPSNPDEADPVFRDVQSSLSGGTLSITASVTDDSGVDRVTALVTSTPVPGASTTWQLIEMSPAGGDTWSGSASVGGAEAEFLLQALDGAGNVGTSLNKELSFGTDLPPAETLTVTINGDGADGVYTGAVTVTATSSTGAELTQVVDSVGPDVYTAPIIVFTPGLHQITFTSESGLTEQVSFIIDGPACTIVGTNDPDILIGTDGDDVICALGGADTIDGGGGNDVILGGDGPDVIDGGDGNDTIDGGDGPDILIGGAGNDLIAGGDGPDVIEGGSGDDQIDGEGGPDEIDGGSGSDVCVGLGNGNNGNGNGNGRGKGNNGNGNGDSFVGCESS